MLLALCGCGDSPEETQASETRIQASPSKPKASAPPRKASPKHKPRPVDTAGGLRFTPGAFSSLKMEPGDGDTVTRTFSESNPDHDAEAEALLSSIQSNRSKENCLDAIARLSVLETPRVVKVVENLLSHPEAEVRGLALGLLEGVQDASIRPMLDLALRDRDPDVRMRAIDILSSAPHDSPDALLIRAIEDRDANVRASALLAGNQLESAGRQRVLEKAAASLQPEIAIAALQVLDAEPRKSNVPLFIKALSHPSPDVKEAAQDMLSLTFYDEFPDAAAAARWWTANQHRYSNTLEELKPPAP